MVFNVCVKFHENMSSGFKVMEWTRKIVNTQRAITQKLEKPELRFLCSARRLVVFKVYVKFHENMSSGFKVMERTRKLLTDRHTLTHTHTHTQKRGKHYTPMAYFVCRGYKYGSGEIIRKMTKSSLHSSMRHLALIILESIIKIFQMVTEKQARNEVEIWIRGHY